MDLGFKLIAEVYGPAETVARAAATTASHVEVARQYVDAGYDRLALINAGPDVDGFFDFFTKELQPELRTV